jgi:hypothetical protein
MIFRAPPCMYLFIYSRINLFVISLVHVLVTEAFQVKNNFLKL